MAPMWNRDMNEHVIQESLLYRPGRAPAIVAEPPERRTWVGITDGPLITAMTAENIRLKPLRL